MNLALNATLAQSALNGVYFTNTGGFGLGDLILGLASGESAGVTSLNSLGGALSILAGSNITVTPSGSGITIAASSGAGAAGVLGDIQMNNGSGGFAAAGINYQTNDSRLGNTAATIFQSQIQAFAQDAATVPIQAWGFLEATADILNVGEAFHHIVFAGFDNLGYLFFTQNANRISPPTPSHPWSEGIFIDTSQLGVWDGTAWHYAVNGPTTATAFGVAVFSDTTGSTVQSLASDGTAGQVLTSNGAATLPTWQAGAGNILVFTSNAGSGGAAAAALTVPGLLSTDTILAVTQKVQGAANLPILSFNTQITNGLTVNYVGDPGPGEVVIVLVKR